MAVWSRLPGALGAGTDATTLSCLSTIVDQRGRFCASNIVERGTQLLASTIVEQGTPLLASTVVCKELVESARGPTATGSRRGFCDDRMSRVIAWLEFSDCSRQRSHCA